MKKVIKMTKGVTKIVEGERTTLIIDDLNITNKLSDGTPYTITKIIKITEPNYFTLLRNKK